MIVASVVTGFFFRKKIEQTMKRFGTNHFVEQSDDITALAPNVIILDLEHPAALELLKTHGERIIAFGPHLQDDLRAVAQKFGAKTFTRSAFFFNMHNILHKHT